MSLSTEQVAKREMELMSSPEQVRVSVKVSKMGGYMLPDPAGTEMVDAVWHVLTVGDNMVIERACQIRVDNKQTGEKYTDSDVNEMKRLVIKRNLLAWSLPIPIERRDGWMTEECYARVAKVAAPLMDALTDAYESRMEISKDEEEIVDRQCAVLFSRNSHGVSDACEAVSLYCTLGNYWDKFGIDRFSLAKMSFREFILLKMVLSKESVANRIAAAPKKGSGVRVAGRGGPKAAAPITIPM